MNRRSIVPLLGLAAVLVSVLAPTSFASHSGPGGPHDFAVGGGQATGGLLPEVGVPVAFAAIETGPGDVEGHLSVPALNFQGRVICLDVALDGSGAHFSAVDPDSGFPGGQLDVVVRDNDEGPNPDVPDTILIGKAPAGACTPVVGLAGSLQGNVVVHKSGVG